MIVKILSSASREFHGVKYNDNKINDDKGELMLMQNFPTFINEKSSQQEVRDYLKSISENKKVKNPQFHAVISTKYHEHSKEELTNIADDFMKEMGYKEQPYIVVFHKDTENNHVHIVSTRIDKKTGKKIKDNFEKLKSQQALSKAIDKNLGVNYKANLEKLLKYKVENFKQLETILNRNGFKLIKDEKNVNKVNVLKNGIPQKTLYLDKIFYEKNSQKDKRSKQIKALLEKYKEIYSNKVFKIIDDREKKGLYHRNPNAETKEIVSKIEYESELQKKMKDIFGIEIVFHFKDEKLPFGYTLIDNFSQKVYKGSDILKMNELFEFTENIINKKEFESLKDYNLRSNKEKEIVLKFFNKKGGAIRNFMLFENKRSKIAIDDFKQLKEDVKEYIKKNNNDFVSIEIDKEGNHYAIHHRYHQIHELEYLIGKEAYEEFKKTSDKDIINEVKKDLEEVVSNIETIFEEIGKSTYVGKDYTEENFKKRKKKR